LGGVIIPLIQKQKNLVTINLVYVFLLVHTSSWHSMITKTFVRGRVVKVVDFKPLAPHRCGFESRQGLLILSCEEASLRNVSGSSQVPVRARNNARKGTWGLPPPVKLERHDKTYTVSKWRKTQNKQTKHVTTCICKKNS
jgi:hypothetical protein